jgi:hypothetical protein
MALEPLSLGALFMKYGIPAAASTIGSLLGYKSSRSDIDQRALDRKQESEEWLKLFKRTAEWRVEDLQYQREAIARDEAREARYDLLYGIDQRNTLTRDKFYVDAARAVGSEALQVPFRQWNPTFVPPREPSDLA